MANYTTIANSLTDQQEKLKTDYTNLNSLLTSIKAIFKGVAAEKLETDLNNSLEALNSQFSYLTSLENALKLLDSHQDSVKKLKSYQSQKDTWSSDDPTEQNPYLDEVATWQSKVADLERKIKSNLLTVSRITSSITLVNPVLDTSYKNYLEGATASLAQISGNLNAFMNTETYQSLINQAINDWQYGFKNNTYNLTTSTLAKCGYSASEIDALIEERATGASPREKAVIAALTLIELGIDNNIKTKYCLSTKLPSGVYGIKKPYDTETVITEGVDCASYVSWALDTASETDFNNSTTDNIRRQGTKVSYKDLQAGDILYNDGHVAMVIDNDDNAVLWADASSKQTGDYPDGMRLQRVSYNTLHDLDYTGYDMTAFYNKSL